MRTERQVPYCLKWLIGISEVLIQGGTRWAGLCPSQQEFFFYLSSLLSGVRQGTCQKYLKKKIPPSCPIISPFTSHSLLLSSLRHIRRPITGAGNIWGHNWTGRQSGKKKEGAEESSWAVNPAVTYIYQGGASLRVKMGSKHFSAIISGKAPRGLGS